MDDEIRDKKVQLILDAPLGKLVRWLRILGFNVYYQSDLDKIAITTKAIELRRLLITRSEITTNLAKKKNIQVVTIKSNRIDEQIKELKDLNFEIKNPNIRDSRCSVCNGNLCNKLTSDDYSSIPFGTKEWQTNFFKCQNCGKLYWEGSHWIKIRDLITKISQNN